MSTSSVEVQRQGFSFFVATNLVMIATQYIRQRWKKNQSISTQMIDSNTNTTNHEFQSSYTTLIGNTPLIKLHRLSSILKRDIFVKMESLNPGGTGKDRAVRYMLEEAARSHPNYKPGCVIVEGSSGSTGISLAAQVSSLICVYIYFQY
jgi:threonine synthase